MPITALPTPPSRADAANFAARGDAFMAALPAFATEANTLQTDVNAKQSTASDAANTATTKAAAASTSEANAATSKTGADAARDAAVVARTAAEAALDSFDDRYLGPKAVAPTLDNDGNALLTGALYFDTVIGGGVLRVWQVSVWVTLPVANAAALLNTATGGLVATNVQAALEELAAAIAARVSKTSATGSQLVPSGTTAQRDVAPVYGAQRANSTLNQQEWWNGTAWVPMGGGATGAPGNAVFHQNDQTVTGDYTIPVGKNAVTAGPISIATGVTVTVSAGSTWSIV